MEIIHRYFPQLTPRQTSLFARLEPLYVEWNAKINVISRKDFKAFYEHHVLHSLAIARFIQFTPETKILDVGTGGGFPGIPLAIFYPGVRFHLIDSIGKKIKVVDEVVRSLQLTNVTAEQVRAENVKEKFDFVVSRAVTRLPAFVPLVHKNIDKKQRNAIANGIIYLKGGDLTAEIQPFKKKVFVQEINKYFKEEYFATKKIVHLPI
ncbi:MAG: 16S rRNA (guanine(527)-N(7))-methyltransferase RsmG [Draconibacterium sp.]|nr:MAG: 16S rRNA (guanine(527)-N(7))-methyltransferase RsmG [Draconibacterium sp.]